MRQTIRNDTACAMSFLRLKVFDSRGNDFAVEAASSEELPCFISVERVTSEFLFDSPRRRKQVVFVGVVGDKPVDKIFVEAALNQFRRNLPNA